MYKPKYTITNLILKSIGTIEASKEIIENSPLIPSWERQFVLEARAKTVHYSTHLEGNPLEFPEVKKIVDGRVEEVVARERDVQEVINYREVVKFIDNLSEAYRNKGGNFSDAFNLKTLFKVHSILSNRLLPDNRRGKIREKNAQLINTQNGKSVLNFPNPKEILSALQDFLEWVKSQSARDTHPVLKSGIVHYKITEIHPFDDQNGRTARALSTLSLYLDGYNIKSFFSLDEQFDKDAWGYYNALSSVQQRGGDLTKWLEYFSKNLAIELSRVKEKVLKLSRDAKLKKIVGQISLSERQEKIVEYIQDFNFINNKAWKKLFPDYSDDTILRDLQDLIKRKIVKKEGKTKAARYKLR